MKNKQNNKTKSTRGQKTVVLHKKNYKNSIASERVLNSNVVAADEKPAKHEKPINERKIESVDGEKKLIAQAGSEVIIEGASKAENLADANVGEAPVVAMAGNSDGEASNEAGANVGEAASDGVSEAQVEIKDALIDVDAAQERLDRKSGV